MSQSKRNRYSADFKAKVALEAIKGEQTLSELGSRFGIHPNMIANWKRQAVSNMSELFSPRSRRSRMNEEKRIRELHEKSPVDESRPEKEHGRPGPFPTQYCPAMHAALD